MSRMLEAAIDRNRARVARRKQLEATRRGIHLKHFDYVDAGKDAKADRVLSRLNKRLGRIRLVMKTFKVNVFITGNSRIVAVSDAGTWEHESIFGAFDNVFPAMEVMQGTVDAIDQADAIRLVEAGGWKPERLCPAGAIEWQAV